MSASEMAAMMTTAASAVCGRSLSSPGTATSIRATRPAPRSPVTCVLEPACSATAVREPLTEMANPWNNPAADVRSAHGDHLAVRRRPRRRAGRRSWRTWRWCRSARQARCRRRLRPGSPRSLALVQGKEGVGSPDGSVADRLHALGGEAEGGRDHRGRHHGDEHGRDLLRDTRAGRGAARACRGPRGASSCSSGRGSRGRRRPCRRSCRRPSKSRTAWGAGRRYRDGQPVHVADLDLFGEQVGDEPELAEPQADLDKRRP